MKMAELDHKNTALYNQAMQALLEANFEENLTPNETVIDSELYQDQVTMLFNSL